MSRLLWLTTSKKWKSIKKGWYKFSRSPLSVVGLGTVLLVTFMAIFAPYIAPFPKDATQYSYNAREARLTPSWNHLFGTDEFGRDVFSRVVYGFRYSLMMAIVVLAIVTPVGVILGLVAGYSKGSWADTVIMRITDIFICVPPLVLAMSICGVTSPSLLVAMAAVSFEWWPFYTRIVYGMASSLRNEFFVQAAEVTGARTHQILFREILPNCLGTIVTKMTLDAGWVILIGASLSFVGLGAQPPTPDLGTMVSEGAKLMPGLWWCTLFPALAIVLVILGFNLLGDGMGDLFATEEL